MDTTNFANSKKRMIRMSPKGVPFVMTAEGKKSYGPKAAFKKTPDGGLRKLTKANSVPKEIAPAMMLQGRKKRSNAGVKRGPQPGRMLANIMAGRFENAGPKVRKVRSNKGKARKIVTSPGGTSYKGMAAATRRKTVPKRMRANPFASLMMM
jgi:hypothetical protein